MNAVETLLVRNGLPGELAWDLSQVLRDTYEKRLKPGEVLCREGHDGDELWFLVQGSLRVDKRDFAGTPQTVAEVPAPAMLGHVSALEGGRRTATCVAAEQVLVRALPRREALRWLKETSPSGDVFRRLLISSMAAQLHRGNDRLRGLVHQGEEPAAHDLAKAEAAFEGWNR